MRRLFIISGVLILIVVTLDIVVGIVGVTLVNHAKGGDTKRKTYISNDVDANILIFGSSRAAHHYDPAVLEDSLELSAYNCGFDGNGIICAYGYIKMIEKRYHPKVIIYEVTPGFDLLVGDNHKYLGQLRYFYDRGDIPDIFCNVDKKERYKMVSNMYRFNSALPQLVMDNLHPLRSDNKGYRPLNDGKEVHEPKENLDKECYEYDSLKLYYIERLINDCTGTTTLVFTISPLYTNTSDGVLAPIQSLCAKYGVPLINHYTDSAFNNHQEYFNDASHLNVHGATEYSKVVAAEIKTLLQ